MVYLQFQPSLIFMLRAIVLLKELINIHNFVACHLSDCVGLCMYMCTQLSWIFASKALNSLFFVYVHVIHNYTQSADVHVIDAKMARYQVIVN